MFNSLRWRIAIWFVCLSSLVYVSSTLLGMWMFQSGMINAIDDELRVFAASLGHAIDVRGQTPYFRDWARTVETEPARSLVTIQLFDPSGKLLESYGPKGYETLLLERKHASYGGVPLRVRTTPLLSEGRTLGFMQLQLSTASIDAALRQFGLTLAFIGPFVILGLTMTSLVVSRKVTGPFEEHLQVLKRFVADASHELNTPLSIIQARNEALQKKLSQQGFPIDDTISIYGSIERMTKIVNDLMLLAEVEGPMISANKSEINLEQTLISVTEEFRQRFEEKKVSLDCRGLRPVIIKGHPDALYRLFANLLENALRYTDPGGSVAVSMKTDDRCVRLLFEDTGIGIPEESLPLIFDRFYRVDKSRARNSGGSGLGLSIVKAIALAHDGKVSVTSSVGAGSTFSITLPITKHSLSRASTA